MINNIDKTIDKDILKLSDEGIERAILASLMKDSSKMIDCSGRLKPTDFVNENNQYLFEIMNALYQKHKSKCSFDISSMMSRAEAIGAKDKFLEKSGGEEYIEYLNIIKNSMIDINRFDQYLIRIIELSTKRKLLKNAEDFKKELIESDLSSDELAVKERESIDSILLDSNTKELEVINLGIDAEEYIKKALSVKKDIIGIPTTFQTLDKKIEGLRRGTLTIISAPKKTGKTAFLMNIGINIGVKKRIPTLMISTEMSNEEIMWRVISNLSKVPQNKIIKGFLTKEEEQKVYYGIDELRFGKFHHITIRGFNLEKIIGVVRKFVNTHVGYDAHDKVKECLILFDYIKMPSGETKSNKDLKEYKLLGMLADGLKILAGDLEIPILTACQTNRAGDVANSYELTWFCDTFMELSKKSKKQIDIDKANGVYKGNQILKITANRGAEEDLEGIDFEYIGEILKYNEIPQN